MTLEASLVLNLFLTGAVVLALSEAAQDFLLVLLETTQSAEVNDQPDTLEDVTEAPVNEAGWDQCQDVRSLLAAFGEGWACPGDDDSCWPVIRKFRLFFCAQMRRLAWPVLLDEWKRFVAYVEKLADHPGRGRFVTSALRSGVFAGAEASDFLHLHIALLTPAKDQATALIAHDRKTHELQRSVFRQVFRGCMLCPWPPERHIFMDVVKATELFCNQPGPQKCVPADECAEATVAVIRCVLGNPHRPPVVPDPHWFAWNGGIVRRIAEAICEGGRFADVPVLGDALEDCGCDNGHVLEHCRNEGPHARGCWVIDLLTGRG